MARKAFPEDFLRFAVGGGEDYELLVTAPSGLLESIVSEFPNLITIVGRIEPPSQEEVSIFDNNGSLVNLVSGGWNHFLS